MENDKVATKRKTPLQLKSLENFYSVEKYPSQKAMEDCSLSLKLTYKQVRGWFAERRRKDKKEEDVLCSTKKLFPGDGMVRAPDCTTVRGSGKKTNKNLLGHRGSKTKAYSKFKQTHFLESHQLKRSYSKLHSNKRQIGNFGMQNSKLRKQLYRLQDVLPSDYILKRVFRKDGPPLGVEFDPLPAGAFNKHKASNNVLRACQDSQRAPKRRKVSKSPVLDSEALPRNSASVKKHGIGKGLMTVWRATNSDAGSFPTGVNFINNEATNMRFNSTSSVHRKSLYQESKRSKHQRLIAKQRPLRNKLQEKRKPSVKRRKVESNRDKNRKEPHKAECGLANVGLISQEQSNALVVSIDDEELELRELQAGPNPPTCSAHLASDGGHGCSLCKDMLARFPPQSVKMKQPLCARPWDSSSEMIKKLFKVFRFLYTHSVALDMCPFTLDEFAQTFHDKDSLLLGKIYVSLLKLLLLDVEREINSGYLPRAAKDCRFLGLLHSVRYQEFDVKFWITSLNPLTWTEILRQVLVAAGFGSKQSSLRRVDKDGNHMARYGLRPGTLKGELFNILSKQGSNGLKVNELAKSFQIVELNLPNTTDELELLICSTLSSDITLFEKISSSAYRLRVNPLVAKGTMDSESDTEDSGSVDDDSGDTSSSSSSDESDDSEELDLAITEHSISRHKGHRKQKGSKLTVYTEIDESHSGEAWVLGLMEGEYSNLSIEEKLNALVALVDLTGACSSIRMEDPVRAVTESIPNIQHRGSGAKIKKSSANQHIFPKRFWGHAGDMHSSLEFQVDSSTISKAPSRKGQSSSKKSGCSRQDNSNSKDTEAIEVSMFDVHPLQSIYLGSDRRYNSYWLFLGPCNGKDPGHRRVYFESSEDGHWEVIDTEQALYALVSALDNRGAREAHLHASLEKRKAFLCQAMTDYIVIENDIRHSSRSESDVDIISGDGSSPVSDIDNNLISTETRNDSFALSGAIVLELGKNEDEKKQQWDRLQAFDSWIWNSFYCNLNAVKHGKSSYLESLARCQSCHDLYWRDEKHCKICHTTFELDFDLEERYAIHVATCRENEDVNMFSRHKVLSSQLQALKAAIHAIEAVIPEEALLGAWRRSAHKLWIKRLRRTASMPELFQVLTDFVSSINEDWLCQCSSVLGTNTCLDEIVLFFPTMPQTSSAVALWLVKLDALIAPHLGRAQPEKAQRENLRVKGRRASS